ncbi:uncharacterized protein [Aristolochia californica]|uniref:uncharacterized protein n=1 Tax=Aristolochia californica TaxID=171875 RepID=UPI0035DDA891
MVSSSHKRRKPSSYKDKPKKRRHDVSLSVLENYSSASDSENNGRKKRKVSKKTKKPSRRSPSREDRNGRKSRSRSERRSISVERKKSTKKRRRPSPSSDSCSSWTSSSSEEIIHKRSRRSTHRVKVKSRRRSGHQSRSSGSCSSCSRCSRSSHESLPPHINPRANACKILKEQEQVNNHKVEAKADVIQSIDHCPSSRSNDSNGSGRKGMLEVGASTNISGAAPKGEVSVDVGDSSTDDLEARLRQKAIENFAKFRFRLLGNGKSIGDTKDESGLSESNQSEVHESSARVTGNLTEGNEVSLGVKDYRDSSSQQSPVVKEDTECAVTLESDDKMPDQISLIKTVPDGQVTKIPKSTIEICSVSELEVEAIGGTAPKEFSSLEPNTGNDVSNKVKGEAKSDSQLEEKTMSVMRGGELVQVSYKVYIPKKSPALARRKLQR